MTKVYQMKKLLNRGEMRYTVQVKFFLVSLLKISLQKLCKCFFDCKQFSDFQNIIIFFFSFKEYKLIIKI